MFLPLRTISLISGYMGAVSRTVDLVCESSVVQPQARHLNINYSYDPTTIIARSIDLGQPIIFVSMNYL